MYSYSCLLPGEGLWPPLQPLIYTCLPAPLLLPPIQTHNFYSGTPSLSAVEWAAPGEYHFYYGPSEPLPAAPPLWAFPQAYAAALSPPFPLTSYGGPLLQHPAAAAAAVAASDSWTPWPEDSSLQAELRWGCVERTQGPQRQLPDYLLRELRRVYGTYPRTDVRITYRRGEFLLQAAPRVREPEYSVQRRVVCRPASSGSDSATDRRSGGGDISPAREAAERGRRRKRKGLS
ncbi:uncharacterized protein C10orf95 homolog [Loxodonta africana]|uniref:uncharacterized protein C10orf95 homolog n=1 Tax=Elephas maximus indicus TaxID=99487 RepID=UPI0021171BD3|nr:uncharacterized protein C10orf95 homolog [Elephas maximus indicus]XP_049711523.1 uncharacterized protein C10orf95 homolog [Elephas maximus indicus]